jgi:hypothetical protein
MRNKDKLDFINQIVKEAEKQSDMHAVNSSAVKAGKDLKNYIQDVLSEHVLKAKK